MTDTGHEKVQRGRTSALLKRDLLERVYERQDKVLDRLIREYRMGSLSDASLRGAVGEITAMADLVNDLDSEIKRGIVESDKEKGDVS